MISIVAFTFPAKPPRTLQIESITSSEVDLMWSPPDIRQGHLPTHYKLYQQVIGLNGQAGKWVKTKQIEAENTTYRVRNLTLGTDYRFRVRAVYRFIGCIGWTVQSKPLDSTQLGNLMLKEQLFVLYPLMYKKNNIIDVY